MQVPSNVQDLYRRYVLTNAEATRLEQEKKDLKKAIIAHLDGKKAAVEYGFAVKLTPGLRRTANATLIESELGVKLTDACYTKTSYDSLSVTPLKS